MKATRTTEYPKEGLLKWCRVDTLRVVIDGTEYSAQHAIPAMTWRDIDPKWVAQQTEATLWNNMMRTIEHHLKGTLNA